MNWEQRLREMLLAGGSLAAASASTGAACYPAAWGKRAEQEYEQCMQDQTACQWEGGTYSLDLTWDGGGRCSVSAEAEPPTAMATT